MPRKLSASFAEFSQRCAVSMIWPKQHDTPTFIETKSRGMIASRSRFPPIFMASLLFDLRVNLVALGAVCLVCLCCNRMAPSRARLRGTRIYVALAAFALTLDAILTFTIFPDVSRYRAYSDGDGFMTRVVAVTLVACSALLGSVLRRARRAGRPSTPGRQLVVFTPTRAESKWRMQWNAACSAARRRL